MQNEIRRVLQKRVWKETEANFDQIIGRITIRVVDWANRPKNRRGPSTSFSEDDLITTTRQKFNITQHFHELIQKLEKQHF